MYVDILAHIISFAKGILQTNKYQFNVLRKAPQLRKNYC